MGSELSRLRGASWFTEAGYRTERGYRCVGKTTRSLQVTHEFMWGVCVWTPTLFWGNALQSRTPGLRDMRLLLAMPSLHRPLGCVTHMPPSGSCPR